MLIESLQLLEQQTANKTEKILINDLITHLNGGYNFSDSLKKYPKIFDPLYWGLVQVGEATGNLTDMLNDLVEYLEKTNRFKKKFIQVLTYPVLVVTTAILVLVFMIFFVLPAFKDLFRDLDAELPFLTNLILTMSELIGKNIIAITVFLIFTILIIFEVYNISQFRYFIHKQMLLLPYGGTFIRKKYIFHFCRTFGTLLAGGINLVHSLEMTQRTTSNAYLKREILLIKEAIVYGEKLSARMFTSLLFPPLVVQMILVGEESGGLSEVLFKIAGFYETEVDHAMEVLAEIIEPILIVIIGLIIGLILIAIYLPLFNMTQLFPG